MAECNLHRQIKYQAMMMLNSGILFNGMPSNIKIDKKSIKEEMIYQWTNNYRCDVRVGVNDGFRSYYIYLEFIVTNFISEEKRAFLKKNGLYTIAYYLDAESIDDVNGDFSSKELSELIKTARFEIIDNKYPITINGKQRICRYISLCEAVLGKYYQVYDIETGEVFDICLETKKSSILGDMATNQKFCEQIIRFCKQEKSNIIIPDNKISGVNEIETSYSPFYII